MMACQNYSWPGNLRELESFVKRYLVAGDAELTFNEVRSSFANSVGAGLGTVSNQADFLLAGDECRTAAGSPEIAEVLDPEYKVGSGKKRDWNCPAENGLESQSRRSSFAGQLPDIAV